MGKCCSGGSSYATTLGTYGSSNYSVGAKYLSGADKDPLEEIRQWKIMGDIYQHSASKGMYASSSYMPNALDRAHDPGNKGPASSSVYDIGAVLYTR